jgi:Asp-tRNA(Asn)/Glu-tRNA(Gln) amidotransferase B subunit
MESIHPKTLALILNYLMPLSEYNSKIPTILANLMMNEIQPKLDVEETEWNQLDYYRYNFSELLSDCAVAQAAGILEHRHVKKILNDCWDFPYIGYDLIQYCVETKLLEETGGDELLQLVKQVMQNNQKAVDELRQGKDKAIGALVGAVMKQQKANPVEIQRLIKQQL